MADILKLLTKVGDSSATVLFLGETGTGKGLLATVVPRDLERPRRSLRAGAIARRFLSSCSRASSSVTCRAHSPAQTRDKTGLFEEAEGGGPSSSTRSRRFRDRAGQAAAPSRTAAKVRPVGATRSSRVDAPVICATNGDLRERIQNGRFLEDLFYRLNDITMRVPALRERREDIPTLAQHFLDLYCRQMEKPLKGFSADASRRLLAHEWRGNVRELEKS
jgi:DNA-binding NtrC family response regulator